MKIAIVGSRDLAVDNFDDYIPADCTEIISGGAKGIDACARLWAESKGLTVTEYLPDYQRYGRGAPIQRNKQIVDAADRVIAFWNGQSKGTKSTVDYAKKTGKPVTVIFMESWYNFGK